MYDGDAKINEIWDIWPYKCIKKQQQHREQQQQWRTKRKMGKSSCCANCRQRAELYMSPGTGDGLLRVGWPLTQCAQVAEAGEGSSPMHTCVCVCRVGSMHCYCCCHCCCCCYGWCRPSRSRSKKKRKQQHNLRTIKQKLKSVNQIAFIRQKKNNTNTERKVTLTKFQRGKSTDSFFMSMGVNIL